MRTELYVFTMLPLPFAGVSEGFEWRREERTVGAISLPQTIAASALKAKSPIILLHFPSLCCFNPFTPIGRGGIHRDSHRATALFLLIFVYFISAKAYYIILDCIASVFEQGQKGHL